MRHRPTIVSSVFLLLMAIGQATLAQPLLQGFLCCNMRSDGSWISDINYIGSGKQIVPAGTPVKVAGYGRHRVLVEMDGRKLAIGNDYSRAIPLEDFAKRYVVAEDPTLALNKFSPKVRDAIKAMRITRGMTRQQVLMAVGYPIVSENPELDSTLWRYWTSRSEEYQVFWSEDRRVDKIFGAPTTRAQVVME